jgi:hypothetical protein
VVLDSDDDREGKWDVYRCKSEGDIERTLWVPVDEETEDEMVVRGVLRVIHHKGSIPAPAGKQPFQQVPPTGRLGRP